MSNKNINISRTTKQYQIYQQIQQQIRYQYNNQIVY